MWSARGRVRTARWTWPPPAGASERGGGKQLKELLQGAYEDVLAEEGIIAGAFGRFHCSRLRGSLAMRGFMLALTPLLRTGSSTACLLALDAETGMLHAAK